MCPWHFLEQKGESAKFIPFALAGCPSFFYVKGPLDWRVDWTDDKMPTWTMEKVSFNAAYPDERVIAYLFLPDDEK